MGKGYRKKNSWNLYSHIISSGLVAASFLEPGSQIQNSSLWNWENPRLWLRKVKIWEIVRGVCPSLRCQVLTEENCLRRCIICDWVSKLPLALSCPGNIWKNSRYRNLTRSCPPREKSIVLSTRIPQFINGRLKVCSRDPKKKNIQRIYFYLQETSTLLFNHNKVRNISTLLVWINLDSSVEL